MGVLMGKPCATQQTLFKQVPRRLLWWAAILFGAALPLQAQDSSSSALSPGSETTNTAPALRSGDFDWVQFKNGEWLKGEIKDLQDKNFVFESDQLETLQLDWDDVQALYSTRTNTLLFKDKTSVEGKIRIEGNRVIVTSPAGEQSYRRADLRSIIPGKQTEWNYWSGKLTLGTTFRRGNVNQTDISAFFRLQRRTPAARSRLDYNGVYGEVEGEETANNNRALLTHDIYLTRRLYARALSFEVYNDKFQNIAYRLTPGAGLGYDIIDRSGLEWSVNAGAGYQYTAYRDVAPGDPRSTGTAAFLAGTELDWEATSWFELIFIYNITLPAPQTQNYSHHLEAGVSFDLWGDLDFDVKMIWDRINSPVTGSDGKTPTPNDVRLFLGLGWEF